MNRSWAALSLILPLAAGAVPARAQDEPEIGSRLAPRRTVTMALDEAAAARAGQRYAGCIYVKQQAKVVAALAELDAKRAAQRFGALQVGGTCINLLTTHADADSQRLSFPTAIYRGLLSEAVIRNQYSGTKLGPLPRQLTYSRPWFAVTGRPTSIDEMNVCVVETDPAGVRALLATSPQSNEERGAVGSLAPALGPCLAAGTRLSSNRQSLRAGLAEALFHRLTEPPTSPGVKP